MWITRERDSPSSFRRATPERWHGRRAVYAFEATGHLWEAVAYVLREQGLPYVLVNPLATFRVREARQMGRDKRDVARAGLRTPLQNTQISIGSRGHVSWSWL